MWGVPYTASTGVCGSPATSTDSADGARKATRVRPGRGAGTPLGRGITLEERMPPVLNESPTPTDRPAGVPVSRFDG